MAAYWQFIDDVWVKTPGVLRLRLRLPAPLDAGALAEARQLLDAGHRRVRRPTSRSERVAAGRRVAGAVRAVHEAAPRPGRGRASPTLAAEADGVAQADRSSWGSSTRTQYAFARVGWTASRRSTAATSASSTRRPTTTRRASPRTSTSSPTPPLRQFQYQADRDKKGEAAGWAKPDFDDAAWKTTDVCHGNLVGAGLHNYMGRCGIGRR